MRKLIAILIATVLMFGIVYNVKNLVGDNEKPSLIVEQIERE